MDFALLRDAFWGLTFDGLALGAIYALISLGYTLVYGVLRLINFAHSEVFMIGTFGALVAASGIMGVKVEDDPRTGGSMIFTLLICLVAAMLASACTAVAVEFVAYRRLRKRGATKLATLISAIGVSISLVEFFRIITNSLPREFPRIMDKTFLFSFAGADIRNDKVIVIVAAAVMMVALDQFISKTRLGKGIRAVSMDENTATLMGVNINRVITVTFFAGGLMAGAAAFFYILTYENTSFKVGFFLGISAFTAAVLGGIGNLRGALFGGFVLGLMETYTSALFGTAWKAVISFIILVLVLLIKPTGLFGESITQARV
ncbi:LivH Branched-chain amino acid ABC-type transport system, permease components [Candidatus Nanopelagicaceae bacterium]